MCSRETFPFREKGGNIIIIFRLLYKTTAYKIQGIINTAHQALDV